MRTLLLVICVLACTSLVAQKSEIFTDDSFAIRGYDPVAYFKVNQPVKGNRAYTYKWKNATWLFVSKENADEFAKNPDKYAPQYGGYCAYGCSEGHKATTDPNAWTIVDGKLYLNYNLKVKEYWTKDRYKRIIQADSNWPKIKNLE